MVSLASCRKLCTLCWFEDDAWGVVDDRGRYDGGDSLGDGNVPSLLWVRGEEAIALDQLRDHYYDPNLLPKHLGLAPRGERPRVVEAIRDIPLAPDVLVEPPPPGGTRLAVTLRNRGGGIGTIVIRVNGKQVRAIARGAAVARDAEHATFPYDLAGDPHVKPGERNRIEVYAYDEEDRLLSKGPLREWIAPGEAQADEPSHLWAVVCGISEYGHGRLRLSYAAQDAERFADALRIAATRLLDEERVHIAVLSTSGNPGTRRADRKHLVEALDELRKAGPNDTLLVYLSGHGVTGQGQDGDYHYLLSTATTTDVTARTWRETDGIASQELFERIQIAAPGEGRQVLILDTCASGRLVERLASARDASGLQERALVRLKDGLGLFILAGCASNRVAYEASRFGQGLLTWSLLSGMKSGEALKDSQVDVLTLFSHAVRVVPELAREVGARQLPRICAPDAVPFPLGVLTPEDRRAIDVNPPRPLLFVGAFRESGAYGDKLKLTSAVEETLADLVHTRGAAAPFYFLPVEDVPDGYQLDGHYTRKRGSAVDVAFALLREGEVVEEFSAKGTETDVVGLARAIVEKAAEFLRGRR